MFSLRCNKINIMSKFVGMYLGHRQKEAIILTSTPRRICIIESLKIESGAFADCTSLTSIAITNNVTSIGNNAFNGCSKLTSTTYKGIKYTNETGLTNALTSNGVSVGSNAFTNTKLQ